MRHIVYGTAGHIDHGKTALVRALTGIDCDRLPEERQRGITIDLGFAHLESEDLQLHFVDVPGHERLVHTMVAGASGIDLALLVVAADEGIMPQTREHLEVIRLMGVPGGAVALTKTDLVDGELMELVAEEVSELLADTPFAGVPVVPVSARTGQGIEALRKVLVDQAQRARPRAVEGRPFREAVDRVFSMAGAGTVITGTSLWGRLERGQSLVIHPGGLESRARRLHVHGEERKSVEAGERVAINLPGLSTGQLHRGQQVLTQGPWEPTRLVTLRLELLASAPGALDEGDELEVHVLAARVPARVDRLASRPLPPGETAVAQLSLGEPVLVFPGDRIVLRRPAPVNTFGGGVVLDSRLPRVKRRDAQQLRDLPPVQREAWPRLLEGWIEGAGFAAPTPVELAGRLGVLPGTIEAALGRLLHDGTIQLLPTRPPRCVATRHLEELVRRADRELRLRLEKEEVSAGIPARDFVAALLPRPALPLADVYLEELRKGGAVELNQGRVVPAGSEEHMTDLGKELTRKVEELYREAALEPPSPGELAERLGARPAIVEGICRYLVQRRILQRLEGRFLIHRTALEGVRRSVLEWDTETFTVGQFKERFHLTRKLAIPILEWLDSERVTRRQGSQRRILRSGG